MSRLNVEEVNASQTKNKTGTLARFYKLNMWEPALQSQSPVISSLNLKIRIISTMTHIVQYLAVNLVSLHYLFYKVFVYLGSIHGCNICFLVCVHAMSGNMYMEWR